MNIKHIYFLLSILTIGFMSAAGFGEETRTEEKNAGNEHSSGQQAASENSDKVVDISGKWITQAGNKVELKVDGTEVTLYFPDFARYLKATFDGKTLIYITHYNNPANEECYIDVPASEFNACKKFIRAGDQRHRFILTLSPDGYVLAGTKEINVLQCEWETDEKGRTFNHKPVGFVWKYFSDYQWRRSNCSFENLPPIDGNIIDRYKIIDIYLNRYGLQAEFNLKNFVVRQRVRLVYDQCYIDSDTGVFVPSERASKHKHVEPLDGRVIYDKESEKYIIELYPYSFRSYAALLGGLTILFHQLRSVEQYHERLSEPTNQMILDSLDYVWKHRETVCYDQDELFERHIKYMERALKLHKISGKS